MQFVVVKWLVYNSVTKECKKLNANPIYTLTVSSASFVLCETHFVHLFYYITQYLSQHWQNTEKWNVNVDEKTQHWTINPGSVVAVKSPSHIWLCDPIDCSTPGFPVLEFAQIQRHWVSDVI